MTATLYERAAVREAMIWPVFQHNGPFNATQDTERTIMFGIYANTYLHGHNYLSEIETEDLARLVAAYTASIAKITNEEAQTVLELAARRYVDTIDQQIHEDNLVTKRQKIDYLDADYDARTDALEVDEQALVTMQGKVSAAWLKADQKIKDLETRTELEDLAQDLVDVDIEEQELKAARADLAKIEAGQKGLDIQLSITQAGIDLTNTELAITNAGNEVDEIGLRVSETEMQESGIDLDIVNAGIEVRKSTARGNKIISDTTGVGVRVAEVELDVIETGAKQYELDAQTSKIEADTARLGLIDSEKTIVDAEKRIAAAENEFLVQEKALIDSKQDNVIDETILVADQQTTQEELDGKQVEYEGVKTDAEIDMSQAETAFEDDVKDMKVTAFEVKKTLADSIKKTKVDDATDRTELHRVRAQHAVDWTNAAVAAAQDVADSNIINTLTHSIGAA